MANRGTILVIEDGLEAAEYIAALLDAESYEAVVVTTAAEGLAALAVKPLAVLLDWGLPDRPGVEVCRQIRSTDQLIPILFVSGRSDEATVARGLDAGANDFISKPFRATEFIARVEAQIRLSASRAEVVSPAPTAPETLHFGPVAVNLRAREVTVSGKPASLGSHEFKLVEYLSKNAGIAISKDQILEHVYGYAEGNSTDRVDMLVRRVRAKLAGEDLLTSVPGFGFRWEKAR